MNLYLLEVELEDRTYKAVIAARGAIDVLGYSELIQNDIADARAKRSYIIRSLGRVTDERKGGVILSKFTSKNF